MFFFARVGDADYCHLLRIIRRSLLQAILTYQLNFTFIDGLLAWNTQRIGEVQVRHDERELGSSGYSLKKLVVLALNLFTNFSLLPLQIASATGLLASVIGLLTGRLLFNSSHAPSN